MSSRRKLRANQNNARASTGPRTAAGKARAAANARRHGLAMPIWSDPILSREAERLAQRVIGADAEANAQLLAQARRFAEPHIDLVRIRQRRRAIIAPAFAAEKLEHVLSDSAKELEVLDRYERRALSRRKRAIEDFDTLRLLGAVSTEGVDKS